MSIDFSQITNKFLDNFYDDYYDDYTNSQNTCDTIIVNQKQELNYSIIDFSKITESLLDKIYEDYTNSQNTYNTMIVNLKPNELNYNMIVYINILMSEKNTYQLPLLIMEHFHLDENIRNKCHELNVKMAKFNIEQSMRNDIYKQIKYYYENTFQKEISLNKLSKQDIRFVEKMMNEYKYIGMDLDKDKRNQIKLINTEISNLSNQFSHNISSDNTTFEFIEDEVQGMPKDWLKLRLIMGKFKDNRQVYKISLKYQDYVPIMEQCSNRNTRRIVSTAYISRCIDVNGKIASDILKLKHLKAKLMRFNQYSDYKLQKQMAKKTETVMTFLNSLKDKIKPIVNNDLDLIRAEALTDNIHEIELWDISYYSKKIKERITNIDMEALKVHFPLITVMNGMFEIYQTLFNYTFVDITESNKKTFWHKDVKLFKVIDNSIKVIDNNTNTIIGYFYLDLFSRPGKISHAAVFPIIRKSVNNLPVCIMTCNFNPHSNLRFDEVETFFHEFGHIMHNIASVADYGSLAGTTCERDFVEAPSQMLEEWCYIGTTLNKMTPKDKPISSEVLKNLQIYRKQFVGYHYARQIVFGLVDMDLHGLSYDQPTDQVYKKIFEDITGLKSIPNTNIIASFGHIFSEYDASYYSYLWSEVYAKDMFYSKFAGKELDKNKGLEYKTKFLQWGSIQDSIVSLKDFLGREPSDEAFIRSISN